MRKEKVTTCPFEGRDKGKMFYIKEMPAARAEKWAMRAFLALAHAGIEVPEEMQGAGWAALAVIGLRALGRMAYSEFEPLMDEMMECVEFIPDQSKPSYHRKMLMDEGSEDVEEAKTLFWLRSEVFELHTGFSIAGALLTSAEDSETTAQNSSRTPTSPQSSARLSPLVKPPSTN